MKKIFKILTINILLILFLFFIVENVMYTKWYLTVANDKNMFKGSQNVKDYPEISFSNYLFFFKEHYKTIFFDGKLNIDKNLFRKNPSLPIYNSKNLNKNIILMGCSYTYGALLYDNQTFSSLLANQANSRVYNLGLSARSPRTMLYLLRENFSYINKEVLENNNRNIDYIIYTYMTDHKKRLFVNIISNIPYYKKVIYNEQEHLLFYYPYLLFKNSFIRMKIEKLLYIYKQKHHPDKIFDLFSFYMSEIKKEIDEKFSSGTLKTKFIIFVFDEDGTEDWEKIKDMGIVVIKAKDILDVDIVDKEYKIGDIGGDHPNAKAWEVIVPALAKELNL